VAPAIPIHALVVVVVGGGGGGRREDLNTHLLVIKYHT
jgi:hypothetical protein